VDNPLIFGFALGPGETVGEGGVLGALSARVKITTLTDAVTYCLKKNDLTPVLKQNPDVARLRCQLVTQRQQTLKKIGAPTPAGIPSNRYFSGDEGAPDRFPAIEDCRARRATAQRANSGVFS
jgi:hypothetical protein